MQGEEERIKERAEQIGNEKRQREKRECVYVYVYVRVPVSCATVSASFTFTSSSAPAVQFKPDMPYTTTSKCTTYSTFVLITYNKTLQLLSVLHILLYFRALYPFVCPTRCLVCTLHPKRTRDLGGARPRTLPMQVKTLLPLRKSEVSSTSRIFQLSLMNRFLCSSSDS